MMTSAIVSSHGNRIARLFATSLLLLLGGLLSSQAQIPGGQSSFNPALLQLFSSHKAFSGKTDLRMLDGGQKETMRMPMEMSYLDGKVRAEVNVSQISGKTVGADALNMFKQAGMDQVASILRPDRKKAIVSFSNAKVFVEENLSPEDAASFTAKLTIQSTEVGRESVGGHPCVKNKVTFIAANGAKTEGMVWNASDLKGFPLKIVIPEGGSTLEMTFRELKLDKPAPATFEAPAGFARYDSMEKLVQERLAKALGLQGK